MVRGLYTAAAGMMTIQERTDTTANNLANADTAGFKQDLLVYSSAPAIHTWRIDDPTNVNEAGQRRPDYLGLTNCGTMDTEVWRDFDQGQLVQTGQELDIAIAGDGWFKVSENGETYYTRDGEFHRDRAGFVVDNKGRRLQGQGGDINVGDAAKIEVNRSGEFYADGAQVATLDLAFFTDPQTQLQKMGDNLWRSTAGAPDGVGTVSVRGGYIERSNVDAIRSLVELIREQRHYEASARVITTEDAALDIAVNRVGVLPQ
jgi:flagellar basal-body rod protein FlgF